MKIERLFNYVNGISKATGVLACSLIVVVMFIVLYEVVMRYVFNASQIWAYELSQFLFGILFVLGGAYALLQRAHVRMDVVYARFSTKWQAIMDIITFVFFLIFIGVLIWQGWDVGWRAVQLEERSMSAWEPLLWPVKMVIPLGAFLVLLQGLTHLVRNILTATGRGGGNER
jgi:TRAP-type mannitol/chloroaromatic compound transport system permease small subunit